MSVSDLTTAAIKHLYAAELLHKASLDLTALMEHMSDEQVEAAIRVRGMLMGYAESELIATQGLCLVADRERD